MSAPYSHASDERMSRQRWGRRGDMTQQITAETISEQQVKALRGEALEANDFDQVAVCDLALDGTIDTDDYTVLSGHMASKLRNMSRDEAYAECARALNDAAANA